MKIRHMFRAYSLCLIVLAVQTQINVQAQQQAAGEPFKLEVEQKNQIQDQPYQSYPSYPAPTFVPQQAVPAQQQRRPSMQAGINQSPPPPMQSMQPKAAVLPPAFLGVWQVAGQRTKIEAQPQYQSGVGNIFAPSTNDTWQIDGSAQSGYALSSSTGAKSQLYVDKVQGGTAFLRYQHQIGNTMAQEAVVMQLGPGGATFSGLERISIVKQGEPQPRAKVTYQLNGRRQR